MNKRIIIGGVAGLLILAGAWYLFSSKQTVTQPQPTSSNQNPFGQPAGDIGGTNVEPSGNVTEKTIQLQTSTGQTVTIPDPTAGKAGSPIDGNTFYFITSNQETQGANAQFDIVYGTDSSISIGLLKEPLGQSRLASEAKLRQLVPLPDAQLCTLKIAVMVPYQINQFYSAENLGLSFCPGAVKLPN
jgi:hypothetical protein